MEAERSYKIGPASVVARRHASISSIAVFLQRYSYSPAIINFLTMTPLVLPNTSEIHTPRHDTSAEAFAFTLSRWHGSTFVVIYLSNHASSFRYRLYRSLCIYISRRHRSIIPKVFSLAEIVKMILPPSVYVLPHLMYVAAGDFTMPT